MPKRKLTYKDFLAYFGNHTAGKHKHSFEKNMMQDAFEEEAFDGLSKLSPDEMDQDIQSLRSAIQNRARGHEKNLRLWFAYAASVIILVGIGVSIFIPFNKSGFNAGSYKQIAKEQGQADSSFTVKLSKKETGFNLINQDTALGPGKLIAEGTITRAKKAQQVNAQGGPGELPHVVPISMPDEEITEIPVISEMDALAMDLETDKNESKELEQALQGKTAGLTIQETAENKLKPVNAPLSINKDIKIKVSGKIVNSEDESGIPGVHIVLENQPNIGTITNSEGYFSLSIPGDKGQENKLIASFIGMESQVFSVNQDTNLFVVLEEGRTNMDEVVVVAYGLSDAVSDDSPGAKNTPAKPPVPFRLKEYKQLIVQSVRKENIPNRNGKYKIKFTFIVGGDGGLSNFSFENPTDSLLNNEIIRAMNEAGRWVPATKEGANTKSKITFSLNIQFE